MSEHGNERDDSNSTTDKPKPAPSGTPLPTLQNRLRRPVRTLPPPEASTAATAPVEASVQTAATVADEPSAAEATTGKTATTEVGVTAEPVGAAPAPRARRPRPAKQRKQVEPAAPSPAVDPGSDDGEQNPHVGPQRVVVYLRAEVAEAVRGARRTGVTNADVIFDAIEQTGMEELKRLVAAQTRGGRQVPSEPGRIFTRQVGSVALNKVRFEARLLGSDCELIDHAVELAGADNRSELIEIALYRHLLGAQR